MSAALTSSAIITLNAVAASGPSIGAAIYTVAETLAAAGFTTGPLINQASYIFTARNTLTTASAEEFDMRAPDDRDMIGQALALTKIKLLYVKNRSLVVGDKLIVGGEGSTLAWAAPFNDDVDAKVWIEPGGTFLIVAPSAAGYPAVFFDDPDYLNYTLKIENPGANSIQYDLIIIGS
jgi:hypothetical protein